MQPQPVPQTSSTTQAIPESEAIARDIKEGNLGGFVGNNTHLTGDATFKGMMRVDGHLSGHITSADGTLIVSTNGLVEADVEVATAKIYGTVRGNVTATGLIEMGRTARVTGNIRTPSLVIEGGALFEGDCRMTPIAGGANAGQTDGAGK
ncbi:MAG: polymer-forming cytoskeletal protein [Acidobacteria bacterium]|nr:polymer-forming cytoskeletal protein [Acidobacteriota bacterium]